MENKGNSSSMRDFIFLVFNFLMFSIFCEIKSQKKKVNRSIGKVEQLLLITKQTKKLKSNRRSNEEADKFRSFRVPWGNI